MFGCTLRRTLLFPIFCTVWLMACWFPFVKGSAQSISGKIIGVITDTSGAVVPRANVEVTNEGTGAQRRLATDDAGIYVAAELPVGFYTVKIEAQGFAPAVHKKIKVDVAADSRVDVQLTTQALAEAVTVTEEAPQIERDSAALAEVISNRQVDSLPLNGRDFRRLTFLIPGAAPRTPRGSFGSFSVNGQREKSNIFLMDGVDILDPNH